VELFEALAWGLLAGTMGTILLTLSETIEMKLTGRPASMVPGQVGFRVAKRQPTNQHDLKKVSTLVHWSHGIFLGAVFGLLSLFSASLAVTIAIFFGIVWVGDVTLYKILGIAQWPWKWSGSDLATDLFNKGIYAVATGITFSVIT